MYTQPVTRLTTAGDIPALLDLFEAAKLVMHEAGNPQWPTGYPDEAILLADITAGGSWLLAQEGRPAATMALLTGAEPTYAKIYAGAWPGGDIPYGTIHRVAVHPAAQGGGLAHTLYTKVETHCRELGLQSIRVDTHCANTPMRGFLAKLGFVQCGFIYLQNGEERLAFEKLLV